MDCRRDNPVQGENFCEFERLKAENHQRFASIEQTSDRGKLACAVPLSQDRQILAPLLTRGATA
jgi:hypothetical protein